MNKEIYALERYLNEKKGYYLEDFKIKSLKDDILEVSFTEDGLEDYKRYYQVINYDLVVNDAELDIWDDIDYYASMSPESLYDYVDYELAEELHREQLVEEAEDMLDHRPFSEEGDYAYNYQNYLEEELVDSGVITEEDLIQDKYFKDDLIEKYVEAYLDVEDYLNDLTYQDMIDKGVLSESIIERLVDTAIFNTYGTEDYDIYLGYMIIEKYY